VSVRDRPGAARPAGLGAALLALGARREPGHRAGAAAGRAADAWRGPTWWSPARAPSTSPRSREGGLGRGGGWRPSRGAVRGAGRRRPRRSAGGGGRRRRGRYAVADASASSGRWPARGGARGARRAGRPGSGRGG
jgi:hypothetical protein